MRTIKFRCWDNLEQRYTANHHLSIDLDGNVINLQNGSGSPELELEQWTGLLDKSGKEIYEGDIVRFNNGSVGFTRSKTFNAVVEDDECNLCFVIVEITSNPNPRREYDFILAGLAILEIIGNIHANPELLK